MARKINAVYQENLPKRRMIFSMNTGSEYCVKATPHKVVRRSLCGAALICETEKIYG
ncbi:MAG: hypothetical protein NC320_07600 [Clostridium sp.]|nr:hypothetical protein [Clostridium sp.]MCM1547056.1 hypothetical protein [Ruminococcus sp.]